MLRLLCLLLPLGTGFPVSGSPMRAVVGQSVTLPCTYPVTRYSDVSSMCWGRGHCPYSRCSDAILRTDGWKVTPSESTRYRMKGDISGGDVSLTIDDVNTSDAGTYCCRVEIPGWFNDKKHELTLEVAAGPNTFTLTYSTSAGFYKGSTAGYIDATQVPVSVGTLSRDFNAQQPEESDSSPLTTEQPNLSSKRSQINNQERQWKTNTTIYVVVPVLVLTLTVLVAGLYIKRLKTNKNAKCISSLPMRAYEPGGSVSTQDGHGHAEDNFYIME
ncbi:hepatitis A virus cellular receptor 2 homolog [Lissotriton helveticus]